MNRRLLATTLAALACFGAARGAQAQVVISIDGDCPGRIALRWEGATPQRGAGLWFSRNLGGYTLQGACAGTTLGLGSSGLRLVKVFATGADGEGRLTGVAPPFACGGYLQMVVADGNPCTTSNVVQIPQ